MDEADVAFGQSLAAFMSACTPIRTAPYGRKAAHRYKPGIDFYGDSWASDCTRGLEAKERHSHQLAG